MQVKKPVDKNKKSLDLQKERIEKSLRGVRLATRASDTVAETTTMRSRKAKHMCKLHQYWISEMAESLSISEPSAILVSGLPSSSLVTDVVTCWERGIHQGEDRRASNKGAKGRLSPPRCRLKKRTSQGKGTGQGQKLCRPPQCSGDGSRPTCKRKDPEWV